MSPPYFLVGAPPPCFQGKRSGSSWRRCGHYRVLPGAEISLEANPGTLTAEKLAAWREAGINRLSIGLQSADNRELRILGRIHTWEEFLEGYRMARKAGFENINIDLMSALPGQSSRTWRETLLKVTALEPEHISAYSLIVEEGTPFMRSTGRTPDAGRRGLSAPGCRRRRKSGRCTTTRRGFWGRRAMAAMRSPITPGRDTSAAIIAAIGGESYRGFGLGASSLVEEVRFKNTSCMEEYLGRDFSRREEERLSKEAQMEEFMFLGLRLAEGISTEEFCRKFGCAYAEVYGKVTEELLAKKLLCQENQRIFLTEQGIDVSNYVMAEFLF